MFSPFILAQTWSGFFFRLFSYVQFISFQAQPCNFGASAPFDLPAWAASILLIFFSFRLFLRLSLFFLLSESPFSIWSCFLGAVPVLLVPRMHATGPASTENSLKRLARDQNPLLLDLFFFQVLSFFQFP